MAKDVIELIGIVEESYPNASFKIRILSPQAEGHTILCTLAGRMRVHRVRILPGDRVKVEMTPYDLEKGRICFRFRSDQKIDLETGRVAMQGQPVTPAGEDTDEVDEVATPAT